MSTARPVVIFGTTELAELAQFYFVNDSPRPVVAFTVDGAYLKESEVRGLSVVPFETLTQSHPPEQYDLFVAIGYQGLNAARAAKCADARARGYRLATYVSSKASTWPDLTIGDNCMIMEDNVIQPFVRIGHQVIMFCSSVLGHHATIGDNCFIGSEAIISGGVQVGENTFIGVNATIREHVKVGRDCLIGAGALIVKDTADGAGYLGTPTNDSGIPSKRLRSLL